MSLLGCIALFAQRMVGLCIGLFFATMVLGRILRNYITRPLRLFYKKKRLEPPACLNDPGLGTHGYVHLEEVRLHYVAAGQEGKPLMLFVHGFPEFWYSWRFQMREFQKDYRVVAFDMRGYADSDKPSGVGSYSVLKLTGDIQQLIPALGYKTCTLVAHDWGGAVAYIFAAMNPDMVDRLIVMNCPHPGGFRDYMRSHFSQFKKSWYMFFFQVPYIPEFFLSLNDFEALAVVFKGPTGVTNGNVTDEDVEAYKYAHSRPGGLTGPINFYRASMRTGMSRKRELVPIRAPTLLIWGCQDMALEKGLAEGTAKFVKKFEIAYIEEASHWVQMDEPEKVNKIMQDWLESHKIQEL